jgi:3'(2'), 5'-bisphosphate nucleotidase
LTDQKLLDAIKLIAHDAGEIILTHYHRDTDFSSKADESPLTAADLESNTFIREALLKLTPEIPIISEETIPESFEDRKDWSMFWLVDPLDGTKEFIKKTGQFTVNIGLISNGKPVLGVIDIPVLKQGYFGADRLGSWFQNLENDTLQRIHTRQMQTGQIDIVASKDHAGPLVQALSDKLPQAGFKSMGSSLKFCIIAAGEADVYLRDVPTMEWDTAAAHAILMEAGGHIFTLDGEPLRYNKESLKNPEIISIGSHPKYWFNLISQIQENFTKA